MELEEILSKVDHTLLSPTAVWEEIRQTCDDAMHFHTASVCIPPVYVKQAADYCRGQIPICTVIGFPSGYQTTSVKCYETGEAVRNGAAEIDMVIHLGMVKQKRYEEIFGEIRAVRAACQDRLLKVIIETCMLTREEKIRLCEIVSEAKADFIKTSTGFSAGGATREDVALLKQHVASGTLVKASGGIRTLQDAKDMIASGASRLGTSAVVRLVKEEMAHG